MDQTKNVKITLPNKVDDLIKLGDALVQQHMNDGPNSNLSAKQVAKVNFTLAQAKDKYEEVVRYRNMMNSAMQELKHLVGSNSQKELSFKQVLRNLVEDMAEIDDDVASPVFEYVLIENHGIQRKDEEK